MAFQKKFPYRSAYVACQGTCRDGQQQCEYGCIGCEKCVENCRFDAISIGEGGVAVIDSETCIACGKCVRVCPQQIIHIHECGNFIVVKCSNKEKGKAAKDVCSSSCIGCGMCEKTCTAQAVRVIENCAVIREDECLSCGMCVVKCSRNAIVDTRGIIY